MRLPDANLLVEPGEDGETLLVTGEPLEPPGMVPPYHRLSRDDARVLHRVLGEWLDRP